MATKLDPAKCVKIGLSLYGTLENWIDGVVITFSNITSAKTVEAQLRRTQSQMEMRVEKDSP